jgi:hypothetical protein
MPITRLDYFAVRLPDQILAKPERIIDFTRRPESPGVGVIGTTALSTSGDRPNRAAADTTPASHARHTEC